MNFSDALHVIKDGGRVARSGWNGRGMFIFLVPGSTFTVDRPPLLGIYPEGTEINYHAHIDMKTADGKVVPWLASQTDLLADDWESLGRAATATPRPGPSAIKLGDPSVDSIKKDSPEGTREPYDYLRPQKEGVLPEDILSQLDATPYPAPTPRKLEEFETSLDGTAERLSNLVARLQESVNRLTGNELASATSPNTGMPGDSSISRLEAVGDRLLGVEVWLESIASRIEEVF